MKWYDVMYPSGEGPHAGPQPMVTTLADLKGWGEDDIQKGEPIEGWDESAWLRVDRPEVDGKPYDVLTCFPILPVYSARMRRAIEDGGIEGIQYLPIQVIHFDGRVERDYSLANVLNVVPALDLERSDCTFWGDFGVECPPELKGKLQAVRIAALYTKALDGYDVVRPKEYPSLLCVSERFREIYVKGAFSGYYFGKVRLT